MQETFRVENVEGRVVLDVLRHVLTACNLASFSLVDCCQSLLSRRLEVLPPSAIARLSSCSSSVKSAPLLTQLLDDILLQARKWGPHEMGSH